MADKLPTDDELVEEITEQYLLAKRYLDIIHLKMNNQEEMYRSYIDKNVYPHTARVFDPRMFRIIETITPRIVAQEPTGSFYPQESGNMVSTEVLNALIKYDWRRAEMFAKLVTFVKSGLIFGTAFGRTYWDFRETEKSRMKPKKVNGKMVWSPVNQEKITVTDFDGPNFEALNIYDCFPDPNSTSIDNMRWFIYRQFKTLEELKAENDARGAEYWQNLDKLEEALNAHSKDDNKSGTRPQDLQFREHRRIMLSTQDLTGQDTSNPEFTILIRYTRDRWVYMIPEYDLIIRDVENPYFHGELPIVYWVDYPYPGELYGMGEIEPLDRIQRAINAVLNQRLDNVQLTLRNMWKVRKGGGVDLHTLVSAPGNIVTTQDMNAVEPINIPDVTGPTFVQTMDYLTSAMQNGSGITDYTQGIQTGTVANKTATGIQLIQHEANAQFKLKLQLFNHNVIQTIANQWKDLRIQYTTEAQKLRIMGKDTINNLRDNTQMAQTDMQGQPIIPGDMNAKSKLEITGNADFAFLHLLPEDIQPSVVGDYDFIAVPSIDQLTDPVTMQQNFFGALDRLLNPGWLQMLYRAGKTLDVVNLTEKIFDKMQVGIDGTDVLTDFPKGMPLNWDLPHVRIDYKDLPPDGKVAAAQNAGITVDPNEVKSEVVNEIGTTQTPFSRGTLMQTPTGQPINPLQPPDVQGPMGPQDINNVLQQVQGQQQQIGQAVTGPQQGPQMQPSMGQPGQQGQPLTPEQIQMLIQGGQGGQNGSGQ